MGFWSRMKHFTKSTIHIVEHPPIHINTGAIADFAKKEYEAGLGQTKNVVSEAVKFSRKELSQDKIEEHTRGVVSFR